MPPRGKKGAKCVKARVKPRVTKVLTPISEEEDSVHSSRASTPLPSEVGDSEVIIIIIIINALFFYGDHVTYKGDFQRSINEVIYIYTHG